MRKKIQLPCDTKEEAIKSSIILWKRLAETGKNKSDLIKEFPDLLDMRGMCPACECAERHTKDFDESICPRCPIWKAPFFCTHIPSTFHTWNLIGEPGKKKALAAKKVLEEILNLTGDTEDESK